MPRREHNIPQPRDVDRFPCRVALQFSKALSEVRLRLVVVTSGDSGDVHFSGPPDKVVFRDDCSALVCRRRRNSGTVVAEGGHSRPRRRGK